MRERYDLPPQIVNRDLLRFPKTAPIWFYAVALFLAVFVGGFIYSVSWSMGIGMGIYGLTRPVMWGILITDFVFWVGISHAGVMISAILRLAQAEWRRPVTRAAEVLTVFSLGTAAMFPLFHTGRPWRSIMWVFPYDFWRGIWPDVRSPLIWDPSAIFTYLTGSSLFVYIALIPDLAVLRDTSTGFRRDFYGLLALGFRGTARQWRLQTIAGILLSALILPVFVSVHSIVSWDFAVSLVPAWHSTVFAPYFVIGAVLSGVAAVATVMALLRTVFGLEAYITPDHFDALGRLLILVGTAWVYFWWMDFYIAIYGNEFVELAPNGVRSFQYPFNVLSVIFLTCGYFIPISCWLFRPIRRNANAMLWLSLLVNVGMWLERYLIIVPGLIDKNNFAFSWSEFSPALADYAVTLGSIALVLLLFTLFSKVFPIIPLFDIKEGQILKTEVRIGRVTVPAVFRD